MAEAQQSVVLSTKNEKMLYDLLKKSNEEKQKLSEDMQKLQLQLEVLQAKYKEIEKNQNKAKEDVLASEYFTDEEELAKESEWIRQKQKRKYNKKRKMDHSLTPPQSQQEQEVEVSKKVPQPPPIVVEGIQNYNDLYEELSDILADAFQIKLMNGDIMKINTKTAEAYRMATKLINEKKYSWHSYENKQNRPIRVIAKNLHHSCEPEKIVGDLLKRGYKVLEANRQLKWRTKQPLNMFMLVFSHDENINKIFEISDILGTRVQIEPLKTPKLVVQCKKCQAYGHTQHYCAKEPRCVKCAGKHLTIDCAMEKDAKPKCVHCGEAHPANYRGCIVAKEMQKLKNKFSKKPEVPQQRITNRARQTETSQREQRTSKSNIQISNKSYAQTVSGTTKKTHLENKQEDNEIAQTLQLILAKLDNFDERLTRLEYSATGAIPKNRNGQRS